MSFRNGVRLFVLSRVDRRDGAESRAASCAYGQGRPCVAGQSCARRCDRNARCAGRISTHQHANVPATAAALLPSSTRMVLATKRRSMSASRSASRSTASVLIRPYTRIELVAARCTSAHCCLLLLTAGILMTSLMVSSIALLTAPLIPLLMSSL